MALYSTLSAVSNLSSVRKRRTEKFEEENYRNYEYRSFYNYKQDFGEAESDDPNVWTGSDVKWLWSDRRNRTSRYKLAIQLIIKSPTLYIDRLKPFEQIKDFYYYTQLLLNYRKHETKWIKGAYYLVRDLSDAYDEQVTINKLSNNSDWTAFDFRNLKKLLAALNRGIANFAVGQFNRLIFGDKKNPQKGQDAWEFDKQFIQREQGPTAFPIYQAFRSDYPRAVALANDIFNRQGIFNYLAIARLYLFIPVFSTEYESDFTDPTTSFGQEARTLVPLAMLYPNAYFYDDAVNPSDVIPFAIKDTKFAKTLKKGAFKGDNYSTLIYFEYVRANRIVMNTFYR